VDDNARWDDYLRYLRDYQGPDVVRVDVSERHQILVVNGEGSPVLAAHISVWASGQEVMQLRTHSDGRAAFLPGALPAAGQAARYTLKITVNGAVEEIVIPAGDAQREWRVVHPAAGATAAPAKLDILFLIDATGSMGDEIQQLKDNIHAIAAQIAALPSRPDVRFAMTVYRDRGDAFVARTVDFTPDVAFFARALAEIEAGGGGDYAEDLNEALYRAIHVPGWRVEDTVSLIFLVADAPPHLDYADQEANYAAQMLEAAGRGFKIFPIASSGLDEQGEYIFRQLAQVSGGRFIFLTYGPAGPGTTGAETEHQVADYSVAALDKLIVRIVATELAPWRPDSNP
jgi:Mg-chelatase subunit ChlD